MTTKKSPGLNVRAVPKVPYHNILVDPIGEPSHNVTPMADPGDEKGPNDMATLLEALAEDAVEAGPNEAVIRE